MSYYIHQTPGRIRVRTPAVKGSDAQAAQARELLVGLGGIKNVACSAATGSITVTYHPQQLCPSSIINILARHGYLTGIVGFPKATSRPWANLASASAGRDFELSPQAKKAVRLIAQLMLPLLLERTLGRPGKILAAAFF